MLAALEQLRAADNERRASLAQAQELFGKFVETQTSMIRSLSNWAPSLLLNVVMGWACVLFFGYGLLAGFNPMTLFMAAVGFCGDRQRNLPYPRNVRPLFRPIPDSVANSRPVPQRPESLGLFCRRMALFSEITIPRLATEEERFAENRLSIWADFDLVEGLDFRLPAEQFR